MDLRERERRPASAAERPSSRFDRDPRPSSSGSRPRDRERERERERREPRDRDRERERRDDRERPERRTRGIEVEIVQREVESAASAPPRRLLDGAPLDIQEAWICEDLMFLLQGVEGSLIQYADGYDPLDAEQRLKGARWQVDPSLG